MSHRRRSTKKHKIIYDTVLLERLIRLNANGLAEPGEPFVTIQGSNYFTPVGFEKLTWFSKLKGAHLPYFNPLRWVVRDKFNYDNTYWRPLTFVKVSLANAVLSNIGVDNENPQVAISDRPSALFDFELSNLNGASLDNAHNCWLKFRDCDMKNTNLEGFVSPEVFDGGRAIKPPYQPMVMVNCDAKYLNMSRSKILKGIFSKSNYNHATFNDCLLDARVEDSYFQSATFHNTHIFSYFSNNNFKKASFVGVTFERTVFSECNFEGAEFSNLKNKTDSDDLSFDDCTFRGTIFRNAIQCEFENCDLTGVRFEDDNISSMIFKTCTKDGERFPPTTNVLGQRKKWTDEDYEKCDNELVDSVDNEDYDPRYYKEDPITMEPLKRGTEMVMVQKGTHLNPDCFNRDALEGWFLKELEQGKTSLTNPKNRNKITSDFFHKNGGFPEHWARFTAGGRKKTRKVKKLK